MIVRLIAQLCLTLLIALGILSGCTQDSAQETNLTSKSVLDKIKDSGKLIVLTRNAPTTYYLYKDENAGLEYDLITNFAKSINVTPTFIVKENTTEILKALRNGEADIAAAGLTQTEARDQHFNFGPAYQDVEQQVVCRRGNKIPKKPSELIGTDLLIAANTSYVETLNNLKKSHLDLTWEETAEFDTEKLLEMVWEKKIGCTIADSNIVSINRRYFPELIVAFKIKEPEPLSWLLPKNTRELEQELTRWFAEFKASGRLEGALERYYGFTHLYNYVNLKSYRKRIKKRLPKYKKLFQEAAEQNELSWTLLAAQSYQESHWNSRAKSPTGVRGMMMLTLDTARELGIKNRINAKNSIFGGAKYLKKLIKRIPETVQEPDKTWFALAAYNVGMGHLYDARTLAKKKNKNPDKWNDIASVLPLLSQKKYYKHLKYGYARGNEPVQYVQRIRDFDDLLVREIEFNGNENKNLKEKVSLAPRF